MGSRVQQIIRDLNLEPHVGYYRRVFTSAAKDKLSGDRVNASAIYYLLHSNGDGNNAGISVFHRLRSSEEIWFIGESNTEVKLNEIGDEIDGIRTTVLNPRTLPSVLIKSNTWFAAELVTKNDEEAYALLYLVVCPGFEIKDWDLGEINELSRIITKSRKVTKANNGLSSEERDLIQRLTISFKEKSSL
jgi:predicted cupin superfamily sugar epimerase